MIYKHWKSAKKRLVSNPSDKNSHLGRQKMCLRIKTNSKAVIKIV